MTKLSEDQAIALMKHLREGTVTAIRKEVVFPDEWPRRKRTAYHIVANAAGVIGAIAHVMVYFFWMWVVIQVLTGGHAGHAPEW